MLYKLKGLVPADAFHLLLRKEHRL